MTSDDVAVVTSRSHSFCLHYKAYLFTLLLHSGVVALSFIAFGFSRARVYYLSVLFHIYLLYDRLFYRCFM